MSATPNFRETQGTKLMAAVEALRGGSSGKPLPLTPGKVVSDKAALARTIEELLADEAASVFPAEEKAKISGFLKHVNKDVLFTVVGVLGGILKWPLVKVYERISTASTLRDREAVKTPPPEPVAATVPPKKVSSPMYDLAFLDSNTNSRANSPAPETKPAPVQSLPPNPKVEKAVETMAAAVASMSRDLKGVYQEIGESKARQKKLEEQQMLTKKHLESMEHRMSTLLECQGQQTEQLNKHMLHVENVMTVVMETLKGREDQPAGMAPKESSQTVEEKTSENELSEALKRIRREKEEEKNLTDEEKEDDCRKSYDRARAKEGFLDRRYKMTNAIYISQEAMETEVEKDQLESAFVKSLEMFAAEKSDRIGASLKLRMEASAKEVREMASLAAKSKKEQAPYTSVYLQLKHCNNAIRRSFVMVLCALYEIDMRFVDQEIDEEVKAAKSRARKEAGMPFTYMEVFKKIATRKKVKSANWGGPRGSASGGHYQDPNNQRPQQSRQGRQMPQHQPPPGAPPKPQVTTDPPSDWFWNPTRNRWSIWYL